MRSVRRIGLLGCTGSIGTQTLDIIDAFPDQFELTAIAAHSRVEQMALQVKAHRPQWIAVTNPAAATQLVQRCPDIDPGSMITGPTSLLDIVEAADVDMWVVAVVGTAALSATQAIIRKGIPIGLACKEVLVSAGDLIMADAKAAGVPIIPIDSEHAALKQCLAGINEDTAQVNRLILTASGGPFRNRPADTFGSITKADALRHPKWDMGAKITIDSSTLMNKGLEVIEAHHLFNMPYDQLSVIIHPQSIIHSMVEFSDGTILSQMGLPDMRFPIQYALSYPEKWPNPWPKTCLSAISPLEFYDPDFDRFPLLKLAFDCGTQGGSAPAVMNAANEAAVGLFLRDQISYTDIATVVSTTVHSFSHFTPTTLDQIVDLDTRIKHDIEIQYSR